MDPQTRTLVLGDSHIRRLWELVEAPPDHFLGSVQLSIGLEDSSRLDLSLLSYRGSTVSRIRDTDMQEIQRLSPNVVDSTSFPQRGNSIAAVESCCR